MKLSSVVLVPFHQSVLPKRLEQSNYYAPEVLLEIMGVVRFQKVPGIQLLPLSRAARVMRLSPYEYLDKLSLIPFFF